VESFHDFALRPLRHYADFGGRSRRSELVAFYLLTLFANILLGFGATAIAFGAQLWVEAALFVLLACPTLALIVRRLHDSGRGGWWSVLGVPTVALGYWQDYAFYRGLAFPGFGPFEASLPAIAAKLLGLGLLVLLLWQDDPEVNRYGANPRYDEPVEESQPA
jgi:uncharacterized membrane protein YhaH (DUF805 family)